MAEKISRIKTGEIRVVENLDDKGEGERTIEKWVEGELQLEERIVEKVRNEVYERVIDRMDLNGEVVDRKVESADPVSSRLQLVEHIATHPKCSLLKEEKEPQQHVQKLVAERVANGDTENKKSRWFLWALGVIIASEVAIIAFIYCI